MHEQARRGEGKKERETYLVEGERLLGFAFAVKSAVDGCILAYLVQSSRVIVAHVHDMLLARGATSSIMQRENRRKKRRKEKELSISMCVCACVCLCVCVCDARAVVPMLLHPLSLSPAFESLEQTVVHTMKRMTA